MDLIANRTRFWFTEYGEGEPVICINGNGCSRITWRHFAAEAGKKFRVVLYEIRGTGESETTGRPGMKTTIKDHAEDLAAIMDVLGIKKAALVGQAGFVALQFAALYPERVSAVAILCTTARMGGKTKEGLPKWALTAEREGSTSSLAEEAMERWFTEPFRKTHADVIELYRKMYAANPPMGYAANCRGIAELDIVDQLPDVKCPLLVIAGEFDKATPVEDSELILKMAPNAEMAIVKGASHFITEEQPEEFNRLCVEYLNKHI